MTGITPFYLTSYEDETENNIKRTKHIRARRNSGSRTKNCPSAKSSGRGTGSYVRVGGALRSLGHLGGV